MNKMKMNNLSRRELLHDFNYDVTTNADNFDKRLFGIIHKASDNLKAIEKEQGEILHNNAKSFLADVWSGLYKMNPAIKEEISPELTVNKKLMEHLLGNEDYQNYREYTRLDDLGSVIGTSKYSYSALEWLKEEQQQNQDLQDAMNQLQQALQNQQQMQGGGGQGQGDGQQQGKGKGRGRKKKVDEQAQQEAQQQVEQAQQALEQAMQDALEQNGNDLTQRLQKANEEAKEENENVKQLLGGYGTQDGDLKKIPLGERIKFAETLHKTSKMKKIAEWAGRFKMIARQKQKSKSNASFNKQGIVFGNEVENLLPSELLLYSQLGTRLDFLRRFAENQTLMFENKGKQAEGKGAIIACLDQSGSMLKLDAMAKGFILALLMIAKKQRRDFAYIPFENQVGKVRYFEKGKISTDELVEIATEFMNGGTNFINPLNKTLEIMKQSKFKKGDIIFVTDGEAPINEPFKETFLQHKKSKEFSMLSIIIGNSSHYKGHLATISDEIVIAKDFENEEIQAKAFSI